MCGARCVSVKLGDGARACARARAFRFACRVRARVHWVGRFLENGVCVFQPLELRARASLSHAQVVELGRTATEDYDGKSCFFEFGVDRIDVSGIKPSALANCSVQLQYRFRIPLVFESG